MRKWTLVAALVAGVGISAAVYAQQKGGGIRPLTALDYAELQQLYVAYYLSADSGSEDCMGYAKLFTPDAEFYVGSNRSAKGTQELVAFCKSGVRTAPSHFGTNYRFYASPEGARGGSYNMLLSPFEQGKPRTVMATVAYSDILVRTREGWRFKERRAVTNTLPHPPIS